LIPDNVGESEAVICTRSIMSDAFVVRRAVAAAAEVVAIPTPETKARGNAGADAICTGISCAVTIDFAGLANPGPTITAAIF
jgi:hypothetical protein